MVLVAVVVMQGAGPVGSESHRVSFLALIPREDATLMRPFLERLHELGYSEGTNLIFTTVPLRRSKRALADLEASRATARPRVRFVGRRRGPGIGAGSCGVQ